MQPIQGKAKVLLIEDDFDAEHLIARYLQKEGYDLHVEVTGSTALDAMSLMVFDLVILDWRLPGLQGEEVLREIRKRHGQQPMVVVFTEARDNKTLFDGYNAGADLVVTKGGDYVEFLATLMEIETAFLRQRKTSEP